MSCWEYLRAKYRTDQTDNILHGDDTDTVGHRSVCDDLRPDDRATIRGRPELERRDVTSPVS